MTEPLDDFGKVMAELESAFGRMPDDKRVAYWGALKRWPIEIVRRAVRATIQDFEPSNRIPFPYPKFIIDLCNQITAASHTANVEDLDRLPVCQSCDGTGYVLMKGLWTPEHGWGRDTVRICYCETGMIHQKSWEKDYKERHCNYPPPVAKPGDAGRNEREHAESFARYLAHTSAIGPPPPGEEKILLDELAEKEENKEDETDVPF